MKSLLIPVVVGLFSLNFLVIKNDSILGKITELERFINFANNVRDVDYMRQKTHHKVNRIIARFNPDMDVEMRHDIAEEIYEMSVKYPNLDVDLICAMITHESGRSWHPEATSWAGAMGLMQIMPGTGKWLAPVDGIAWTTPEEVLYHPVHNIRMGCRYLSTLIEMYGLEGGLAAYNGGGRVVERWLASDKADDILWAETRNYVPFVLKLYDEFKKLSI
ncbi:MAG: lytic transglycosylase domain-containing protein [bacterium]